MRMPDDVALRLTECLEVRFGVTVYRVGDELPVPIGRRLDPETLTAVDAELDG